MTINKVVQCLKKLENAAKVGVDKGKFEPSSPTILTKCNPVSSRALNMRSRIYVRIGGTIKLQSNLGLTDKCGPTTVRCWKKSVKRKRSVPHSVTIVCTSTANIAYL